MGGGVEGWKLRGSGVIEGSCSCLCAHVLMGTGTGPPTMELVYAQAHCWVRQGGTQRRVGSSRYVQSNIHSGVKHWRPNTGAHEAGAQGGGGLTM